MRVLCLLLFALPCFAADPEVATVLVFGSAGQGSGAVLEGNDGCLVLTNKHVCERLGRFNIRAGGKQYAAECIAVDTDCDLALLRVKAKLPALKLADHEPAKGATVRLFGYGGLSKSGKVYGPNGTRYVGTGDAWYYEFNSQPGDSGAPLIDADDNLAGLVWGNHGQYGVAVRLNEVRRFLDRHK